MGDRSARGERSRSLFVGNLPFDQTEEQLLELFRTVGPVQNVRLVFERETGKPRGFGFVEFYDLETASSALRNLQGHDIGGRSLRLDYAGPDPDVHHGQRGMGGPPPPPGPPRGGGGGGPGPGPPPTRDEMPKGVALAPGEKSIDRISATLATLPPPQLLDIMSQMKGLVMTSPDQAKALLSNNPQVTYALFQVMLMMNLVELPVLQRILNNASGTSGGSGGSSQVPLGMPPPPPPMAGPPPPAMPPNLPPPPLNIPPPPPQFMPPPPQPQPPRPPPSTWPPPPPQPQPQPQPAFAPAAPTPIPAPVPAPAPQPQPQAGGDEAARTQALIQQVLSMSQEQVDMLPPDQKNAINAIRQQARNAMVQG